MKFFTGLNPTLNMAYQKKFTCILFAFILLPLFCSAINMPSGRIPIAVNPDTTDIKENLAAKVVVRRTAYGVPHIKAETIRAAGYALGYVQIEDYGEDVIEDLLRARGEWTKYHDAGVGDLNDEIDSDAANRRKYARAVETWNQLETDTRDMMEGFAAGVNRYIEQNPAEFCDWVRPFFTGYDVHAGGIGGPSRTSINRFLNALERRQSKKENSAASLLLEKESKTVWARLAAKAKDPHPDSGSNVWALAPGRTTSGNAILVRNPHLSWDAGYYEAHVTVPGKLNFYGDFRIGRPLGIVGGFNEHLGWATTNNYPDLDEVYALDADPDQPDHYLLDGKSVLIEREKVTVEFKNGQGRGRAHREFLTTPFGPVIHRGNGKVYIIHAGGDGEYRTDEQFLKMMKARNIGEWKQAMRMRARTASNLTYADAEGNIFYVWNATIPDLPHASGGDTLAIPVSNSDQIWSEAVAWDDLPQLQNPEGGYLHNENDPFHYTNLNEIFDKEDFPAYFPEPRLRLRSQHSIKLIQGDQKFSLEDIITLKHSMRMLLAERVKDDLVSAVRDADPTGEVAEAIHLIEEWDNSVARESLGGVLFKTWWWRYVDQSDPKDNVESTPESAGFSAGPTALFNEPWSPDRPMETPRGLANPDLAVEAFKWAINETKDRYGAWNIPWGKVHRARIGDKDLPVGGGAGSLGCFRVLWFTQHEHDEQKREVRGGDGWVLAVEFSDTPRAYSVLAYGQSNKKNFPHHNDQLELFTDNEMKRVVFTEQEIREHLVREYHPGSEPKP